MSFSPGHVRAAIMTMRTNRWRSLLTMFGIIVGVASVITIIGISQGVKNEITSQVNAYSKNVITVSSRAANLSAFGVSSTPAVSTLTNQDVKAISKIQGVRTAVPLEILSGEAKGDKPFPSGIIIATTQNLPLVLNQSVVYGSFFNDHYTNAFSVVLGSKAAHGLFGNSIPLGYSVNWRNQQFVVDGVMNAFNSTPFSSISVLRKFAFLQVLL